MDEITTYSYSSDDADSISVISVTDLTTDDRQETDEVIFVSEEYSTDSVVLTGQNESEPEDDFGSNNSEFAYSEHINTQAILEFRFIQQNLSFQNRPSFFSSMKTEPIRELRRLTLSNLMGNNNSKTNCIEAISLCLQGEILQDYNFLVAIDIGVDHLSYIIVDLRSTPGRVCAWETISLEIFGKVKGSYWSESFERVVNAFLEQKVWPIASKEEAFFIYERMFLKGGQKLSRTFQHLLSFEAHLSSAVGGRCEALSPKVLSTFFQWKNNVDESGAKITTYASRKAKKQKTLKKAFKVLGKSGNASDCMGIHVNSSERMIFESSKKKDDMADCLVLAYAYLLAIQNRQKLILQLAQSQ